MTLHLPLKELTMFITADQISATNKTNLDAVQNLATKSFAGVEKLVELNLAATKAVINESFAHVQSLLSAKDAQAFFALQTGLLAPLAEKTVSYGRHVYGIAVETGAEFTKAAEGKAAEAQKSFNQVVENVAKNAPAGTESAVTVIKSALASSQSAIESAQSAAKQALAMAESNISAVTEQALSVAASVGKKA
ncbi:MAG: phasin [Comamonadaceae bacterium]|nr:MAG: phasin [Comamonadaceae bacterium]